MLSPTAVLDPAPRRILVAGVTGAGKSSLALRIAAALDIPYSEIDALYHGPNWTPRPTFLADVAGLASSESWVTEWQYRSARATLAAHADTLLWLDYPVRVTLYRLIRRTIKRRRTHQPLWAGNVEPPLWHLFVGRDHIIAWALRTQFAYKKSIPAIEAQSPHLRVVRLRSQRDADLWMGSLGRS